ncbi:hypothetical protein V8F20_003055 [Naviculisporaceae sp. PSN 640]
MGTWRGGGHTSLSASGILFTLCPPRPPPLPSLSHTITRYQACDCLPPPRGQVVPRGEVLAKIDTATSSTNTVLPHHSQISPSLKEPYLPGNWAALPEEGNYFPLETPNIAKQQEPPMPVTEKGDDGGPGDVLISVYYPHPSTDMNGHFAYNGIVAYSSIDLKALRLPNWTYAKHRRGQSSDCLVLLLNSQSPRMLTDTAGCHYNSSNGHLAVSYHYEPRCQPSPALPP